MRARVWIAAAAVTASTVACGGGGGGGGGGGPVKPAGDFTAFLSDGTQDGRVELFVADADGQDVRAVSGFLDLDDGNVSDFAWSPDRTRIAYLQDTDADGHKELFVVDPAVGAPLQLRDPGSLVGAAIHDFLWSPNSQYVAFRETPSLVGSTKLWVVQATGGPSANVSGAIVQDGHVMPGYSWRPFFSLRIAFRGDLETDGKFDLYTNIPSGFDRKRVNDFGLNPGAQVEADFAWSHDGSRIAFRADMLLAGQVDLYTNDPDGGDEVLESDAFGDTRDVESFRWSPTASVLAFAQDAATNEVFDLLTVVSPDGTPTNLTNYPAAGVQDVAGYEWSPDGTRLAVMTDIDSELSTVAWTGGAVTSISHDVERFSWSPDGARLAYVEGPTIDDPFDTLTTVGPTGANPAPLSDTEVTGTVIARITWAPDASRILYASDEGGTGGYDLRIVGALGGGSLLLKNASGLLDSIQFEAFAPNSQAVCFLGGTFLTNHVFTVLVDGTDEVDLCAGLQADSDASDVQLK